MRQDSESMKNEQNAPFWSGKKAVLMQPTIANKQLPTREGFIFREKQASLSRLAAVVYPALAGIAIFCDY